jgi:hypothetical protein
MADMLSYGLSWLSNELITNASEPITYVRGTSYVDVQATLGKKLLKLDDGLGGIRMEWTDMDFLIKANDLTFDGVQVIPERGDLVYMQLMNQMQIFEVTPFGGTEPAWVWCDPFQTMYRIHTKYVDANPAIF